MAIPNNLLEGIAHLDPLPITIQRLVEKLGDDQVSPREIADIVEYDQAIATTLLRVANSAAMGSRFRIERISDAVVRLGVDQLLDIALGSHLRSLSADTELYDLTEDELWLHGAVSSIAAKEIIAACPNIDIPTITPIAALAHDVGKLVLVRYVDADMNEILRVSEENELTSWTPSASCSDSITRRLAAPSPRSGRSPQRSATPSPYTTTCLWPILRPCSTP